MDLAIKQQLREYLSTFINSERRNLIEEVLNKRTRYLTVILEDVYQSHNANAVLRTCECLGIQDLHIVENRHRYRFNPMVAQGAKKWMTIHRHRNHPDNTRVCFSELKSQGYCIAAMTPDSNATPIDNLVIDKPIALCFGSEQPGLSNAASELADVTVYLPMHGFTNSFNLSVCAAVCVNLINNRIRDEGVNWSLTEEEKLNLRIDWLRRSTPNGEALAKHFIQSAISDSLNGKQSVG